MRGPRAQTRGGLVLTRTREVENARERTTLPLGLQQGVHRMSLANTWLGAQYNQMARLIPLAPERLDKERVRRQGHIGVDGIDVLATPVDRYLIATHCTTLPSLAGTVAPSDLRYGTVMQLNKAE